MFLKSNLKAVIPKPLKQILRPLRNHLIKKNVAALSFWRSRIKIDKGKFSNTHYERLILTMAEEPNNNFLHGKIVADFGCGPRGSLVWASSALLRIGIDVLADRYAEEFTDNITSHGMIYLKSTEKVIPLPTDFVDIIFTLNAIDHVDNFSVMCNEIMRVLKPGGQFIGSFNLEEPASSSESQQLNEEIIKENLLNNMEIQSYRITDQGPIGNFYAPFFDGKLSYKQGQKGILWVRAKKKTI
ncbi:MAG: methyltransferase domain-containing protein [Candidatus Tenebribacter burtonii]|jgi:SAM-dependent methyltransferase|nr:methyltransferase domain-containing protein [Candidatus Tenebribacter burtonii]